MKESRLMALFERDDPSLAGVDGDSPQLQFPTEPAFVVPVIVKETPRYGEGHKGVFALAKIPSGTKFWIWTDRIISIHHSELEEYIKTSVQDVEVFLRQGFVLPDKPDYFHSNPTDAGRFINHSSQPNCGPDGALRDILPGEELTSTYSFFYI